MNQDPFAKMPESLRLFFQVDSDGDLRLSRDEIDSAGGLANSWVESFNEIDALEVGDGYIIPSEVLHFERIAGKPDKWSEAVQAFKVWNEMPSELIGDAKASHALFALRYLLETNNFNEEFVNSIFKVLDSLGDSATKKTAYADLLSIVGGQTEELASLCEKYSGSVPRFESLGPIDGKLFLLMLKRFRKTFEKISGEGASKERLAHLGEQLLRNISHLDFFEKSVQQTEADFKVNGVGLEKTGKFVDELLTYGRVDLKTSRYSMYGMTLEGIIREVNRNYLLVSKLRLPDDSYDGLQPKHITPALKKHYRSLEHMIMRNAARERFPDVKLQEVRNSVDAHRSNLMALLELGFTSDNIIDCFSEVNGKFKSNRVVELLKPQHLAWVDAFLELGYSTSLIMDVAKSDAQLSYALFKEGRELGLTPGETFKVFLQIEPRSVMKMVPYLKRLKSYVPGTLKILRSFEEVGISEKKRYDLVHRFGDLLHNRSKAGIFAEHLTSLVRRMHDSGMDGEIIAAELDTIVDLYPRLFGRGRRFANLKDPSELRVAAFVDMARTMEGLGAVYGISNEKQWEVAVSLIGDEEAVWDSSPDFPFLLMGAKHWGWSLDELSAFSSRIREASIDISEIATMIANSEEDLMRFNRPRTAEAFADQILSLKESAHISRFGRYSVKILDALSRPPRPHRHQLVVDVNSADHNGAFYRLHRDLAVFVDQGYDIDLHEVANEKDVYNHLAHAYSRNGRPADVWMVAGHGKPNSIRLGVGEGDESIFIDTEDSELGSRVKQYLADGAQVILQACSALLERADGGDNIGTTISRLLGLPVWGNKVDGILGTILFGADGIIEKVTFAGSKPDYCADTGAKVFITL